MDIFKLFYNHDQRLDKLAKRNANKTPEEIEATLADFMTPTPTYSKFYLTGTRLEDEKFGLNILHNYPKILEKLDELFTSRHAWLNDKKHESFTETIKQSAIGDAIILSQKSLEKFDTAKLQLDDESNVGHFKSTLREILEANNIVVYKEKAHHGFDLHIFSKENFYADLFHAFKPLVNPEFRFFSINSKRMRSEKHFYFETWTLEKPPHGAEEVLPDTVL